MTAGAIQLSDVRFRYEDMDMCFDIAIDSGDFVAVIGPSGAGKSTLLNLIAGFEAPLSGHVRLGGRDVTGLPPSLRPVTMLFQEHNLFVHLNVETNVGLGVSPALKLTAADRERIATALQRVGLTGFERRLPGQLSGGERQRVAIARALVRDKPVLLLDEPFAALGPALRREMLDLVSEIHREKAMTVLIVSHQPEDARHAARHTAFVHQGQVLAMRDTESLFAATDIPELTRYLGG